MVFISFFFSIFISRNVRFSPFCRWEIVTFNEILCDENSVQGKMAVHEQKCWADFFFQWRTTCWLCLLLNNTIKLAIIFMKYKNELEMEEKKIFLKIYFPSGQKCVGNKKKSFSIECERENSHWMLQYGMN